MKHSVVRVALASAVALGAGNIAASAAWEPVRPVELIVPAGTGGGADQMARTIPTAIYVGAMPFTGLYVAYAADVGDHHAVLHLLGCIVRRRDHLDSLQHPR
jgi:tripartite-type tricarboxylate transporter receptor subunit TctC